MVFISYNHNDLAFVRELYTRLTRDGVNCFFDRESIEWGANFVIELEKGLDKCDIFIPVLSPEYVKSDWTAIERTSITAEDPAGRKKFIKPLLCKKCEPPRFLKPLNPIDVSTSEKFEKEYPRICLNLGGTPNKQNIIVDKTALPPVSNSFPDVNRMPFKSIGKLFAGKERINELWKIDELLNDNNTAIIEGVGVIAGAGGIGKTQLAIEYTNRFAEKFPGGIFWLDAETGRQNIIFQLTETLKIASEKPTKEDEQLLEIWKKLSGSKKVLVIYDNFPEKGELQTWIAPNPNIKTLVTTRRRDLCYSKIELNFLNEQDGIDLLNREKRKFGPEAGEIVKLVGGLPLALEIIRNYLNNVREDASVNDLINKINSAGELKALDQFAGEYDNELPTGHEKQIAATFEIDWKIFTEEEKNILRVISMLAPHPIPRSLLKKILMDKEINIISSKTYKAINELKNKYSFIEIDKDNNPSAHRLIIAFVKTKGINEELKAAAIKEIIEQFSRIRDEKDVAAYKELEKIEPHALFVARSEEVEKMKAVSLLDNIAKYNWKKGRYNTTKTLLHEQLSIIQKEYPSNEIELSRCSSNLALVLKDLGEYKEAKALLEQALSSDIKEFGEDNPTTAVSRSNLAQVLQDLGEYEEAKVLLEQALSSDIKNFGEEHPTTARSRSNLAAVLKDLGRYEEAKVLFEQALSSDIKNFGEENPTTARIRSNFATVLQDLGENKEAKVLLEQALSSDIKNFGEEHPSIAIRRSNLALVLKDLGEYKEAKVLLEQALSSNIKNFGEEHRITAISRTNLALVLQDLGRYEEAINLSEKAYNTFKNKLGVSHPNTKTAEGNVNGIKNAAKKNKDK
jgi:tetratricopeptide (TPR) repeat protein